MAIHRLQGPDGKIHLVEAPDGTDPNQLIAVVQQQLDEENLRRLQRETTGVFETGKRAVARGFGQLGSTVTDVIPAIGGSLLGFNEYAKEQLQEAEEKRAAREAKYPTLFRSYKEVEGALDAPKFAIETIGEQAANIASVIGTVLATRGLGLPMAATALGISRPAIASQAAARGLTGEAAEQFVAQRLAATAPEMAKLATRADIGSAFFGSYALNAPEIFENIYENNDKQLAPGASLIWGVGAAALDSILPYKLSRQLTGPMKAGIVEKVLEKSGMDKGILRSVTAGALSSIGTEGLTEGAQEAISIAAERFVSENPKIFGSKEWDRIMESGIRGAVAGGAFGGAGGGVEGLRARAETTRQKAVEAERDGKLEEAERLQQEADKAEAAYFEALNRQAEQEQAKQQQFEQYQQGLTQMQLPGMETSYGTIAPTPPVTEPQVKEPKFKQAEMFTAEGALTPQMEKAAAKDQKAAEQAKLQFEKDRLALQKRLSQVPISKTIGQAQKDFEKIQTKQATTQRQEGIEGLTPPSSLVSLAGAPTAPTPPTAPAPTPVTLETIQKIEDPVAFGKLLGIGRTARVLRADGPLAGADLSNPDDVKRVKAALNGYASGKPAPGAAEKIEKLFQRPEFQGVPTDATRPDQQPSGAGAGVPSERVVVPPAGTVESAEPSRVDTTGGDVSESVRGEEAQPVAVAPEVQRAVDFVQSVEAGGIPLNPAKIRTIAQDLGLEVKKSARPEETIQRIREAVGRATATPSLAPEVTPAPAPKPAAPKPPKKKKAVKAAEPVAPVEPEMTSEEAAYLADLYGKEQVPVEERGAMIRRKKATREEVRALEKEGDEATKSEAIFTKTGKKLSLPKYEGPAFDETQRRLAESGDVNGLLRNLLDSIKDPEIKQVLRRIRSLNLKTKIKIAPIGQSGIYNNALTDTDPDTIFLDPEQGMNAHTFIHEAVHAAISNVLSNPNHPLTKQFQKFFISVQDRLGAAYGATDLQEFAAELMGNPSFQAILKTIKTPKSDSMFTRIIRSIAEFFGFADTRVGKALLETTAFSRGVQFLNDAIDITNDVPPTEAEQLFLSMGKNISKVISKVNNAMPAFAGRKVEETKNFLSNLSGSEVQQLAFNLLRLDHIYDMYKKELPSTKMLLDALEKRVGQEEKDVTRASENYKKFVKVQEQHAAAMRVLNDLAIDISDAQVDVLQSFQPRMIPTDRWNKMSQRQKDEFVAAENKRRQEHAKLKQRFDVLPEEVKDLYKTIRTEYDAAFKRYRSILEEAAKGSPALLAKLREEFTINQPLAGYIPYLRYGDYWLEFTDPKTNEPTSMAFESIRERDQFVASELKGVPHQKYEKLENIAFNEKNIPPTHFLNNVVNKLRSEGASDAQINGVYQAYLAAFPAESIAKQFMKRKGTRGMERDIVRGYSDLMVRWSRKLANSEYLPQIDRALAQIAQEGEAYQRNAPDGAPAIGAAVKNIESQKEFFHNPTYNNLVSGATQASFFMYMAGNISSAIINLTSLPLMVYPLLTGKFGWMDVPSVMLQAGRTAMNDWSKIDKYKKLYETLDSHGQLKHTMAREILEGRRQKTEDFTGIKARIMDGLAIPFSVTERYNRGATAIAAFDLAIKNGMNEQQAIDYALETVKTAHTSGMAATGPKWMQNSLGRIFFTFKSFIWNSAYVLARAFYQAFKGEKPEIREAARRQLIATYGMATVFVGVKGMPFYGAVSVLAEMLASMFGDDDEPFDFNAFLRELLPTFLYKGLFNYVTNLEVANRAGIATDLVFRDDPRGVAENGYVLSAMQQAFGPVGSILVNSGRALELFKDGNYWRSIETLSPSFVRNGMKGVRYLNEGALTLKGDPVDEDIGVYNSMMQVVGFSPADLSNRYEMLQSGKGFEREVEKRRRDALRLYDMAARSGDAELMGEVRERIQSFNEKHPKYRITQDSLVRSRKAREAAEKDMIYGVRFNKNLRAEIKEKFFEDEE